MFIIVFDDNQGMIVPFQNDADCEGAVECIGHGGKVAVFDSRKAARKAIDISAKNAALMKAQGKPANDDFLPPCRKNIRILPCVLNPTHLARTTDNPETTEARKYP